MTTYGILSTCFKDEKLTNDLGSVEWYRIIIDEAHCIKNQKTRVARALCALNSQIRWCLTGTPIHNQVDDLYSLLHFLQLKDFSDRTWWAYNIASLIRSKNVDNRRKGFFRLQTILQPILMRRKKTDLFQGKRLLELPPVNKITRSVQLEKQEDIFYKSLWKVAKKEYRQLVREGSSFFNILTLLLRVRQACDHYYLVLAALRDEARLKLLDLNKDFEDWCKTALEEMDLELEEDSEGDTKMKEDGKNQVEENNPNSIRIESPRKKSQTTEIGERNSRHSALFCFGCMDEVDSKYSIKGCSHRFCSKV